jgi:hypothetical protein
MTKCAIPLTRRFGGLTAFTRAPAAERETAGEYERRDELVVFESERANKVVVKRDLVSAVFAFAMLLSTRRSASAGERPWSPVLAEPELKGVKRTRLSPIGHLLH